MSMMIMMEVCISRILQGWPKRELVKNTFRGIRASLAHSGKTEGADSSQTVSAKQVLDKQKAQAAANLPQLKLTLYVRWGVIERLDLHRTRKRLVVCYMPTEVSGEIQFSDCLFSTCTEIYRSMNIHSLRLPDTAMYDNFQITKCAKEKKMCKRDPIVSRLQKSPIRQIMNSSKKLVMVEMENTLI